MRVFPAGDVCRGQTVWGKGELERRKCKQKPSAPFPGLRREGERAGGTKQLQAFLSAKLSPSFSGLMLEQLLIHTSRLLLMLLPPPPPCCSPQSAWQPLCLPVLSPLKCLTRVETFLSGSDLLNTLCTVTQETGGHYSHFTDNKLRLKALSLAHCSFLYYHRAQ